jgi:hypothetical protein
LILVPALYTFPAPRESRISANGPIKAERQAEQDDFNDALDFNSIYRPIDGTRSFTRIRDI